MALAPMSGVTIEPYCDGWPAVFHAVKAEILLVFAPNAPAIEHIGSTSVTGLAAKPVIDVMLGVAEFKDVEEKIPALSQIGYNYIPKYEKELPMRRYFVKSALGALRVHLHSVEVNGRLWQEHLKFRDTLRADPKLAAEYQALKFGLAHEFAMDKSAYTAAKAPFIQAILSRASICELGAN